jgi:uncharacterized protein (DUF58 family)
MGENKRQYLDPVTLSKIGRLELKARLIVEGYISGLHKSPYHGFSVEFAQHRSYVPGDDLKHLDWKVLGRSDRYYIKQYEEETNVRCLLLVDTSESMQYKAPKAPLSKLEYAKHIAAALTHLILNQQDAVGLMLFDEQVRRVLRPSSSKAQVGAVLDILEGAQPSERTSLEPVLHDLAERIGRKSMVIILSDLFDDPDRLLSGLAHFRHRQHEVVVFQVLDHDEITFPFQDLTRFEGLEQFPDVNVDPRALREGYLDAFNNFRERVRRGCRANQIDYVLLNTSEPLDKALSAYLATRKGRSKR